MNNDEPDNELTKQVINKLRKEGLNMNEIANFLGKSTRTIYRILEQPEPAETTTNEQTNQEKTGEKQNDVISMDTARNEIFKHQVSILKRLREAVEQPFVNWLDWSEWRSKAVLISGQTPLKYIFQRSLAIQLISFNDPEKYKEKAQGVRLMVVEILTLEILESYKELTNFLMRGNQP